MDNWLIYFVAGIIVGWITKIPVFLHMYRTWEKEMLEEYKIHKRILEMMKEKEIKNNS